MVQCAHHNQRVVHISELSSNYYTFTGHSAGENAGNMCCVYGSCTCNSLDHALANLTNNVLINITTDMTLFSLIKVSNLENVSIIGYNDPVVNCKSAGGILFTFCCNCIIQGITWNECGTEDVNNNIEPGLALRYSTNITIRNCFFQYSKGQAVLLSAVSGNVRISNCNFTHNSQYRGHGAAIHFSSSNLTNCPQLAFTISDCNFTYNNAKSSVYIQNKIPECNNIIVFHSSKFCHNQGSSVYVISQNIHLTRSLLFQNNTGKNGTGIYIRDHSTVLFGENSEVKFVQNFAQSGGAIFLENYSGIAFEENSTVTFNNNRATNGTIYSMADSRVIFKATCQVTFDGNSATHYGSAIYSFDHSRVKFIGNSKVTFISNVVSRFHNTQYNTFIYYERMQLDISSYSYNTYQQLGGTIFSENNGYITFDENSSVVFSNNMADFGAAIFLFSNSNIIFKERSRVIFNNNTAQYCGVLTSVLFSSVTFNGNTEVVFNANNIVSADYLESAGAMCISHKTDVIFSGHSLVKFTNNTADRGGATTFSESNVIIEEYSRLIFNNNIAHYTFGAAFTCCTDSNVTFRGNSNVQFNSNMASQDGGAIYLYNTCKITFEDNSNSTFVNNTARNNGGAIFSDDNSNITSTGNSLLSFISNKALQSGGAVYLSGHCNFIIEESSMVIFNDNKASHGGAICINGKTKLLLKENSTAYFCSNMATASGGALNVIANSVITLNDHFTIKLTDNSANYGGAIFLDTTAIIVNNNDKTFMQFTNNIARIFGNSMYQAVPQLCNSSCINDNAIGISSEFIATPPNELKLHDPAICIDNDNDTQCNNYYVQNIMLGKEIVIPACVLDYYKQSVNSTQFLVQGEKHPNFFISGPNHVLISCDAFKGIKIIANKSLLKPTNFTISIVLNTALYTNWKQISVNLTIELSPCHPGFWQFPESEKCECYNTNDLVFCSGSNSTIKRGYWFGSVTGKPTATFCPINYCNFTCCETSNGYYHLSPVRDNQCRSHRSGAACGNCKDGYTLSYDSTECVNVENCTAGQTVLVVLLTILYWIVMVTSVFAIMYYKVGIGYLYGITYYYSIVDILLSQSSYNSREIYLTVSILSSFSKIIPQFLGELCLTTGISGIDQQFIHYIHPTAVILILGIISSSARISQRISLFIRRGIIHVICLLLLLSYTSIASTSLLLMRSLTFHGIDEVYTFLSPDIEYFHDRHLVYGIVALLCMVVIVMGLPLLLALEPFLNRKFNFIKIKPLLDQFQGCYKDKYRCFAGYYMICRLVIITIVIAKSADDFVANYILIIVSGIIDLIHISVKPYSYEILNKFDSIILHLIIFIAALALFDDFDSPLVITIAFVLVITPLLNFLAMTLFLHKDDLKKIAAYFTVKDESSSSIDADNNKIPMKEFNIIVDNSMRENATTCDM